MPSESSSQFKYGDKPSWQHAVEAVEALGGSASKKQIEDHLKSTFPNYADNTAVNLYACCVNSNARGNWLFNKKPRRSDDELNPHHQYDRLFKSGSGKSVTFELYEPNLHGVWELYRNELGKWVPRQIADAPLQDEARQLRNTFEELVDAATALTPEERQLKLLTAAKYPRTVTVTTNVFIRNEYVVAEVLRRAEGRCEKCTSDAPFVRAKDGTPYLEVHHVVPLAKGGQDSVDNAVAVCPNCHRRAHFG
jgi:5-methylcytosine-specific restriction protein A